MREEAGDRGESAPAPVGVHRVYEALALHRDPEPIWNHAGQISVNHDDAGLDRFVAEGAGDVVVVDHEDGAFRAQHAGEHAPGEEILQLIAQKAVRICARMCATRCIETVIWVGRRCATLALI